MPRLQLFACALVLGFGNWMAPPAAAEVSVLTNRTRQEIVVHIATAGQPERTLTIPSGACRTVYFDRVASVRFGHYLSPQVFGLDSGSAYLFATEPDGQTLRMEKIGLGPSDSEPRDPSPWAPVPTKRQMPYTLPVKIAVADSEPTHRTIWEPRFRERIEAASAILERNCGVKLAVVAVETWEADESIRDFARSMREFERKVPSEPGQLVIGFSSQYDFTVGRIHLGASRGPLHPYIMLKERAPNVREPEKLELLVHEICHYLGASHSPEPASVMRPVLTISQLRQNGHQIYIDPVNTLLMALLVDELAGGQVKTFGDVSFPTKRRMMEIYQVLQQALPGDLAAGQFQSLASTSRTSPQLTMEVREIVSQLTRMAKLEKARAQKQGVELAGDDLTAKYVREAAAIAIDMHSPDSAKALLLALGIFMDDSTTLRSFPATSTLVEQCENDQRRLERIAMMGKPTIYNRADLVKHFFVSAHLAVTMGGPAARSAGLAKEVLDANGGTGFSMADMTANRAGIVFAEKLLAGEISLEQIANSFVGHKYMPEIEGATEGLQAGQLASSFSSGNAGVMNELRGMEERIRALPIYQSAASKQ